MDPTRHITYEETKFWIGHILFWKKKMDPSRNIMKKKKFLDWSFFFFSGK